jgi:hypothetical protein
VSDIFANYRNVDAKSDAPWVTGALENWFGGRVVLDHDPIERGPEHLDRICTALEEARVMVVVIGPKWLSRDPTTEIRFIDHTDDWIRQEISYAVKRKIKIIAERVDGASLPSSNDLPPDIRRLAKCRDIEIKYLSDHENLRQLKKTIARTIRYRRFASTSRKPQRQLSQLRVESAAKFCAVAIQRGALQAVQTRVAEYVGDKTWDRVVRRWRGRNCTEIARLARAILDGKGKLGTLIGKIAGCIVPCINRSLFARHLAEEMARRVPLPIDQKATIVARVLQLCGMVICLSQGRTLSNCACFTDVVELEGKERVNSLIESALTDWTNLADSHPRTP